MRIGYHLGGRKTFKPTRGNIDTRKYWHKGSLNNFLPLHVQLFARTVKRKKLFLASQPCDFLKQTSWNVDIKKIRNWYFTYQLKRYVVLSTRLWPACYGTIINMHSQVQFTAGWRAIRTNRAKHDWLPQVTLVTVEQKQQTNVHM